MPTFHEAVISKYMDDEEEPQEEWMRVPKRTHLPPLLSLSETAIDQAGDEQQLQKICARVTELDLSKNEFKDFCEVTKILKYTPCLNQLNLNGNKFDTDLTGLEDLSLNKLSCFVLNCTLMPWDNVHQILKICPNLQELYISSNNYDKVEISSNVYPSVKRIYFNDNPVKKWDDVQELGSIFPNLEHLVLVGSSLQSLCQQENNIGEKFPLLQSLSLNSTDIDNWESVDALNSFPKLTDLRLHHCPLGQAYEESVMRNLTIARLPKIEKLNGGGAISYDERIDAERAFIRHYKIETPCPSQVRLDELISVHGDLEPLPEIKIKKQKEVTITIRYEEQQVIEKTVSVYLKISDLLKSLENELGLLTNEMEVVHVEHIDTVHVKYFFQRIFSTQLDEYTIINKPVMYRGVDYGRATRFHYVSKQLYQIRINNGDEFYITRKPYKKEYLKKESGNPSTLTCYSNYEKK